MMTPQPGRPRLTTAGRSRPSIASCLDDLPGRRESLLLAARRLGLCGTVLLADEGINGTIAGQGAAIAEWLSWLRTDPRLSGLQARQSVSPDKPFKRLKVRIKAEIVSMGQPGLGPASGVGTYVQARHWNALISDPDVIVIDTRNHYEVALGRFERAIDPGTRSFRELPQWLREQPFHARKPRVAMYCTGGIRCEKSTALLRAEGYPEVYHLAGGILKYLEDVPAADSLWRGDCFVFDERVALDHDLQPGGHALCPRCGQPRQPTGCPACLAGDPRDEDDAR
ncbi:MAG: rhodanese-related sulfurtransferase [Burkholderiaceae bacterium]